ncbi:hypothetical protein [Kistimonas asteriae]|uniref:hypothetical protein n=1 Tax=Kistimonas asteriae TaxID=517724 RepID=UPI001BA62F37|nr:hypothetical protein [Kistimonas asteriae]
MDIFDIDTATKDELIQHAQDMFNTELNGRDKVDDLRVQVKALYAGETADSAKPTAAVVESDYEYCLNPKNKRVLIAAPGMRRLVGKGELVPCDKDGKRL